MRSLALDTLIWGSFTLILKPPLEIHFLVGQHVLCSSAQRGQRAICIHAAGYCVWVASKRRQQILKILRSGWSTNLGFDKLFESLLRCSCLPDSNSRIFGQQACTTLRNQRVCKHHSKRDNVTNLWVDFVRWPRMPIALCPRRGLAGEIVPLQEKFGMAKVSENHVVSVNEDV